MTARVTLILLLALASAACASVLGLHRTSVSHPFEHRAHALRGINCVECHQGVARADTTGPAHVPSDDDCRRCHTKPHDERACRECHGETYVREGVELARKHLRFEHRKHMGPTNGDCVRCHEEITQRDSESVLPKMASCFGCHQHRDQWTLGDCDGCHVEIATEGTAPSDHLVHDADFAREHGVRAASARDICSSCHSERSCAACHGGGAVPALPTKLAFDEIRLSGLHRAGFRSRHAEEARADPGLCVTCHTENSCIDCHVAQGVAPGAEARSPHPRGWISTGPGGGEHGTQARIDPVSCAGCHGGAGEQLCINCHRVGGPGGNPHGRGFSSKKNKFHDVPCRLCHGVAP
jgi:Cytochrome c7 and related cytochrome c